MNTHDFIELANQINDDQALYSDLFEFVALIERCGFKVVKDEEG